MKKTIITAFSLFVKLLCATNACAATIDQIFSCDATINNLSSFLFSDSGINTEEDRKIYTQLDTAVTNHGKRKSYREKFGKTIKSLKPSLMSPKDSTYVNREDIAKLKDRHPNVAHLHFSDYEGMLENTLDEWIQNFPAITSIHLGTGTITDEGIFAIAESWKLQKINLSLNFLSNGLTENAIISFIENCPTLREISIDGAYVITYRMFIALSKNPELQILDVSCCVGLTNEGLMAIAENCKRLQEFHLFWCETFTEDAVISVIKSCPELRRISLSSHSIATDKTFIAISENPKLQILKATKCDQITNEGLMAIKKNCKELKEVKLSEYNNRFTGDAIISKNTLISFIEACPKLELIDLYCMESCTDDTLNALILHCPWLKNVSINGCPQVTYKGVIALAENCSKLKSLRVSVDDWPFGGFDDLKKICREKGIELL
ncbi:MAG: hypothetical protein V4544_04710 [Pseudomonadota bacterium]